MKQKKHSGISVLRILALIVILGSSGCDDYSDHFFITPPAPIRITVTYPELAAFDFIQSATTTTEIPSERTEWKVSVKRLNKDVVSDFSFLINVYKEAPFTRENLAWTKAIVLSNLTDASAVTELGKLEMVLAKDLLEVIILDNGVITDNVTEFGGYFRGEYTLSQDAVDRKGLVSGFIDCSGRFKLELDGVDEFKFISGQGVRVGSAVDLYSDLTDSEGKAITPFNCPLTLTGDDLHGSAALVSPDYDKLEINLKKITL